jgi:predicted metal-dependent hydrolase
MQVKIIRSRRRRRTVSAHLSEGTLLVNAPLALSRMRLDKIIAGFKLKFEKKRSKDELERRQSLSDIATRINEKYFDNQLKINSIKYVTGQSRKFGCCNYNNGNIRISHKTGLMPAWVRDYVIIHEMAHLIEPNHGRAFWAIVSRYKLAERARGFLIGSGWRKTI